MGMDSPGVSFDSDEVPYRPSNPGSQNHPDGCKPCNKYNAKRPEKSCRQALTCEFCHGSDHDRPIRRGQRGRHALQRRLYLEAREDMPAALRHIVDEIYKVPAAVMEQIKRRLECTPDLIYCEQQVQILVEGIAQIADQAQLSRPDGSRVALRECIWSDVGSMFKWLTGALHLMVRKMWDDETLEEKDRLKEMSNIVTGILQECKKLPLKLDEYAVASGLPISPEFHYDAPEDIFDKVPPWAIDKVEKLAEGAQRGWLRKKLCQLVLAELQSADEAGATHDDIQQALDRLGMPLQQLPYFADTRREAQQKLLDASSLAHLWQAADELVERFKAQLLDADSLEDLENALS